MRSDHVVPSAANAEEPATPPRWARLLAYAAVTLLLIGATAAPFVATEFGPGWAFLVPVIGGAFIIIAVLLSPPDEVPGGRVVYWLCILSGRVREYVELKTAARAADEHNQRRYADLTTTLADYGLAARTPALLTPPKLQPGQVGANLTGLAHRAATTVCTSPTDADLPPLASCLQVLFAGHHPSSCTTSELADAEAVWFGRHPDMIPALAKVVERHQAFRFAGDDTSMHIRAALEHLRSEGHQYELSEVVDRVRRTPTQIVADMNTVAVRFGFGKLIDEQLATVAGKVAAVGHHLAATTTAVDFADRLSRSTDSEHVLARQLELLYREHYDPPTLSLWSEMDVDERRALAARLCTTDGLGARVPRSEPIMNALLHDLTDFDIELVREGCILIGGLLQLVDAFVDDARANGVPECAWWTGAGSAHSLAAFLEDADALPTTHAELTRLESPALAVTLVRHVATQLIHGIRTDDAADDSCPLPEDRLEALAFTAAGLYLCAGERRPDLAHELGEQARSPGPGAGTASLGDFAAEVLLARMWRRRAAIDAGQALFIPLRTLLCEWSAWLDNARTKFGERLTADVLATIRQQVRHGRWPTRLPIEWQLQQSADQIIEASRSGAPTAAHSIQQHKDDVATMLRAADHDTTSKLQLLIDKIEHFDPTAQPAEQERMRVELAAVADRAGADSIEEIADAVHDLADAERDVSTIVHELAITDGELVRGVRDLRTVDDHLAHVVDELAQLQPSTSHRFLLTFKARSGALGQLIDYLDKPRPGGGRPNVSDYDFDREHTPYSRRGRLQPDEDFDDFLDRLERDLDEVYSCRIAVAPRHDWTAHPLRNGVVHVQQIGRHGQHLVP